MPTRTDPFGARATLSLSTGAVGLYRLDALAKHGLADLDRLPMTVKIMLENALRRSSPGDVSETDVRRLAQWRPGQPDSG
ncbi:MAG: hypothetical protein NZ518_12090, partial [Dehalococcoidia bacterium]|nr:hypothetical protein [Dehalococcoidia bacterium]